MMVAVDPALLEEIKTGQAEVIKLIAEMRKTIGDFDKYGNVPEWPNIDGLMQLDSIPFKDRRAVYKWVDRGVIRSRGVGRKRLYSKADGLDFLNRRDRWKAGLALD